MAKKKQVKQHSTVTPRQVAAPRYVSTVVIALAIVLFYGYALFAPNASIQWDAVDVHLSSQHYFATELAAGRLVRWTPYIFSGFPFLADPQVGAFYPLNWPFFLAGAGPKAIQAEVALHSLLACSGMYVLLGCWMKDRWARLVGAFAYGLGGFFAGHASHVAMIQGAGLLPWVLYFAESALREKALRWIAACGFATGLIFLAGHFQTGLYCCGALTLYLLARTLSERAQALRALAILAGVAVLSILVAAVVLLPGYELSTQSIRAHMDFSGRKEGALAFPALATLFAPDALGALGDHYSGPADITQYYFYGGLLLIPLALLGLKDTRLRWLALGLLVPSLWYMSGPAGGLYGLVPVPIRAPVNGWFVAALGLALLAAAGAAWVQQRFEKPWLGPLLVALFVLDLCTFNAWNNPMAYGCASYEALYGSAQDTFKSRVASVLPPGSRLAAPDKLTAFGSLNHPLDTRVETTYGYNPLELSAYAEYRRAAAQNPKLLNALNASVILNPARGGGLRNPEMLPRAWFPRRVREVRERAESLAALPLLDPAEDAVVEGNATAAPTDARVLGIQTEADQWRVRYHASGGGLLALSLPYYPGWSATVGAASASLLRTDHALTGVAVPAGEGEVVLRFKSNYLAMGALLSLAGLCLCFGMILFQRRQEYQS